VLHPQPVVESIMIWVAGAGLILNLAIAWGLTGSGGHGDDINVRAVWIHIWAMPPVAWASSLARW
jgi:Co/Zn/Cd efflux system component